MFKSFTGRFFFVHAFVTFILFSLFIIIFYQILSAQFIKRKYQMMLDESISLNQKLTTYPLSEQLGNHSFFYQLLATSRANNVRILMVDSQATVLLDSVQDDTSLQNQSLTTPIVLAGLAGDFQKDIDAFPPLYDYNTLITVYPFHQGVFRKGAFVMLTPFFIPKEDVTPFYLLLFGTFFFLLSATYLSIYLFSKGIRRILNELNTSIRRITGGDFTSRITIGSKNDIAQLATSINHMAAELGKVEEMRKEFIANISHDFRSPLTSISGFIQAILDGTIPPEKNEKYLKIVLDESKRLTKLTNDILLLRKMENKVIQIHPSDFDLHIVLRKVLSQFEQRILEKNILVTLLIPKEKLFVYADLPQIQRVITNLIDNAIKFCQPDATLTLETSLSHTSVEILIRDSGPGIPENELPYIWDRFYKTDHSRGKDKTGTGLGLSIVREIIRAHKEEIFAYSKKGYGTSFVFTLPLSHDL